MKKRIFLICSVRDADVELKQKLADYVASLEVQGYKVHYPTRDTEQDDPSGGYLICKTNFQNIIEAQEVHVWYSESSQGSKFDMGGVFMLYMLGMRKKIVIANESEIMEDPQIKKSFLKVMRRLKQFEN